MKFYPYGDRENPVLLLIPGTCCHHTMFDPVLPGLTKHFHVVVVSFDGFDESEQTEYPSMTEEIEKIEAFLREQYQGKICCAYGCSLGGSFVAYLVQRQKVHIDHAIIGSSDMDAAGHVSAWLQTKLIVSLLAKPIQNRKLPRFF